MDFLATQERRRKAIERLQALRERLPPAEITNGEMQEIVATVREVRAQIAPSASMRASPLKCLETELRTLGERIASAQRRLEEQARLQAEQLKRRASSAGRARG